MLPRRLIRTLLILLIAMSVFLTAFAFPQEKPEPSAIRFDIPASQTDGGREFGREDWLAHLPLACATVVVVIAVNGLFLATIVQRRRQGSIGG